MTSLPRRLLASVGVVLLLAGCTTSGQPADDPTASHASTRTRAETSARPVVGDCWQEDDYVTAGTWDHWQGAGPVDCQAPHNTITFAVVDLPADLQLSTKTLTADERRSLSLRMNGLCAPAYQDITSVNRQARTTWLYYQPSPAQVTAGQRWVRCDVAIRAAGPLSDHKLEALPPTVAELTTAMAAEPARYQWCLNGTAGPRQGPRAEILDGSAVTVSCEGSSDWVMAKVWDVDLDHAPTDAEAMAIVTPVCGSLVDATGGARTSWYAYWPTADEWSTGARAMTCWLYGPRGTPSTT